MCFDGYPAPCPLMLLVLTSVLWLTFFNKVFGVHVNDWYYFLVSGLVLVTWLIISSHYQKGYSINPLVKLVIFWNSILLNVVNKQTNKLTNSIHYRSYRASNNISYVRSSKCYSLGFQFGSKSQPFSICQIESSSISLELLIYCWIRIQSHLLDLARPVAVISWCQPHTEVI